MIKYDDGVFLERECMWMDAHRKKPFCVVSHAHSDHLKNHEVGVMTGETAALGGVRNLKLNSHSVPYRTKVKFMNKDFEVSLIPSGHILGSAQVLVENDFRILYSGDFCVQKSLTADSIEYVKSDYLIMECTYGNPKYVFPKAEEVRREIRDWCLMQLRFNRTPVVYAYSLGKCQEIAKALGDSGISTSLAGKGFDFTEKYVKLGVRIENFSRFSLENYEGKVVVAPPQFGRSEEFFRIKNKAVCFASGWALDKDFCERMNLDKGFILSDHSDFFGLISYAKRVSPSKIYLVHGPREFGSYLKAEGFEVEYLEDHPLRVNKLVEG